MEKSGVFKKLGKFKSMGICKISVWLSFENDSGEVSLDPLYLVPVWRKLKKDHDMVLDPAFIAWFEKNRLALFSSFFDRANARLKDHVDSSQPLSSSKKRKSPSL